MKHFFYAKIQSLTLRRALGTAFAVFIAVWLDRYFSRMQELLVPLTAILIMQISVRTNLRLALQRFIIIMVTVLITTASIGYLHDRIMSQIVIVAAFILACYLHTRYAIRGNPYSTPLIVAILILLMLVPYPATHNLYDRMNDVILGGVIGIVCGLLIFPGRADVDFRIGVIAIFEAYEKYLMAITDLLFQQKYALENVSRQRVEVERVLQIRDAFFPDWVYAAGYNLALREGHRHFLMQTEQVGTILFAMQHVARLPIKPELLDQLREPITHSIDQTVQIMKALVTILRLKKLETPLPNFAEDMSALNEQFQKVVPLPLELLDISPDYIHLSAFIYDLKDLQKTLLVLAEALR